MSTLTDLIEECLLCGLELSEDEHDYHWGCRPRSGALTPKMYLFAFPELDISWMDEGACVGHPDRNLFMQDSQAAQKEAKAICRGCDVREKCLAYALAAEEEGVWGGTTSRDRIRLRKVGRKK